MISELEIETTDDPDRPQRGSFEKLCGNFDKNISIKLEFRKSR